MRAPNRLCLLYAGPTLRRAIASFDVDCRGVDVLPPIVRGDVPRVMATGAPPGVLIIVDGYFHLVNLSVGHLEIRMALQLGWQVWGLCSMGALRACELRHLGMRGYGRVFQRYCDDPDFRDDEVALLHESVPSYRELSEPLIHMREGLTDLVARGVLSAAGERAIVEQLESSWFGDRTLARLKSLVLAAVALDHHDTVTAWVQDFDRYRIKVHDLVEFLGERPWQ